MERDDWGWPNETAPTPGSSVSPKKPAEAPKQTPPHVRDSTVTFQSWVPFDSPYAKDGTLAEGGMQAPNARFDRTGSGTIPDSYGKIRGMPGAGKVPLDGDSGPDA